VSVCLSVCRLSHDVIPFFGTRLKISRDYEAAIGWWVSGRAQLLQPVDTAHRRHHDTSRPSSCVVSGGANWLLDMTTHGALPLVGRSRRTGGPTRPAYVSVGSAVMHQCSKFYTDQFSRSFIVTIVILTNGRGNGGNRPYRRRA